MKTLLPKVFTVAIAVLLSACTYDAPLTTDHTLPIDPALLGTWIAKEDGEENTATRDRLVILKFSPTEYLIHYPADEKDGTYYRGYAIRVGDRTCMQLEVLGSRDGLPTDAKRYLVANHRRENNRLEVRMLNDSLVDSDLSGSESIREAFIRNASNPELFHDPGVFVRSPP